MAQATDALDREQLRDLLLACVFLAEEHVAGRLGSVENQDLLTETRSALASQEVQQALRESLESMALEPEQRRELEQVIAELSSGQPSPTGGAPWTHLPRVRQALGRARQAREQTLGSPESMDSLMHELRALSRQVDLLLEGPDAAPDADEGKPRS